MWPVFLKARKRTLSLVPSFAPTSNIVTCMYQMIRSNCSSHFCLFIFNFTLLASDHWQVSGWVLMRRVFCVMGRDPDLPFKVRFKGLELFHERKKKKASIPSKQADYWMPCVSVYLRGISTISCNQRAFKTMGIRMTWIRHN